MKAAQIDQYGGVDKIKVVDINKIRPGSNQVLIRVRAASINPFDTSVREGKMRAMKELDLPSTLGGDVAGEICELGENVDNFSIGDKVYGQASVFGGGSGAFAEYAATSPSQIAIMPSGLDYVQAAALPLTGVSALQALSQNLNLKPGEKLFIQGGSGGIGTIAIQLAKHIGAYVATTVAPEGMEYAKELGADKVIDYKNEDFADTIKNYDAVFDLVGDDLYNKSIKSLRKGGRAVSMTARADQSYARQNNISSITQGTKVNTESLMKLRKLVEDGVIKHNVDKTFELNKIQNAFACREEGKVLGKVVIVVGK